MNTMRALENIQNKINATNNFVFLQARSQNEEYDKLAEMVESGPVKAISLENLSKRRPSAAVIS